MPAKALEIIHYPTDGSEWQQEFTYQPDAAIIVYRLDRDEWPYFWLHTIDPVDGDMPVNGLCVMGGRGEYSAFLWKNGKETHYLELVRGNMPIRIWESDQGSIRQEKNLCNDRSRVLRIAVHFAETGELDPAVPWEER